MANHAKYDMKKNPSYNFTEMNFSRVSVVGCPGSGKTTFSKRLGEILRRPVVHLDKLLWGENWQMLPFEQRQEIHGEIIQTDQWIIDGMWKSHLEDRLSRATLVIFLDYKRSLCLRRAIMRRIKYRGKQRDDIADGCLEKLDSYFLHYIWTFPREVRPLIKARIVQSSAFVSVTLRNPKQARIFLDELEKNTDF